MPFNDALVGKMENTARGNSGSVTQNNPINEILQTGRSAGGEVTKVDGTRQVPRRRVRRSTARLSSASEALETEAGCAHHAGGSLPRTSPTPRRWRVC